MAKISLKKKKLGWGQQKATKVNDIKRKKENLQPAWLTGDSSVT